VDLVTIELVHEVLLLGGELQRLPVVTELLAPRSLLCHGRPVEQTEDQTRKSV